jgi:peptide/nickel transport system permease protein
MNPSQGAAPRRPDRLVWVGGAMTALLVVAAVAAPWLAPYDPLAAAADSFGDPFPPQTAYWLGTDELGRDVLSRLIYGARISLLVAAVAMAITLAIGVSIGVAAGFAGGWLDTLLMRTTDVVLAFPALLLALALAALMEPGLTALFIVIGIVSWTGIARAVRAEVLSLRERDFITAVHALGAGSLHVVFRHVLPNVAPTIVIMAALSTSQVILLDAGLSYLGFGAPVPSPSWGRMISDSQALYRSAPWLMIFPGLAVVYAVIAFNFLGYGLLARSEISGDRR